MLREKDDVKQCVCNIHKMSCKTQRISPNNQKSDHDLNDYSISYRILGLLAPADAMLCSIIM